MRIPFLVLAAAGLFAIQGTAAAQRTTLRPFRSNTELSSFVSAATLDPARPAAPPASCTGAPPPPAALPPAMPGRGIITGRVASANGCPQNAVAVRVSGTAPGAVTDAQGRYHLSVAPDTQTVSASRVGLRTEERRVVVGAGQVVTADFVMAPEALALEGMVTTALGTAAGASITNTQHEGVDEGGIVKTHGEHLVILRRGRLFTVRIGRRELRPVSSVDAFGPGIEPGEGWYDEMLVSEDRVVVIGYSYHGGGTEIGLFGIDDAGRLRHESTYHLRSDDYYSATDYTSRLIDGTLILYTPMHLPSGAADPAEWLPAIRRWHPGARQGDFTPIVTSTRVFRPARDLDHEDHPTLHTVTTCRLRTNPMSCKATAVVGPHGSVFYVSPRAVYVWTTSEDEERGESVLYRMPLDGSAPSALGVLGSPADQFSFLESEDRHLNVLVRSDADGSRMWSALRGSGELALLRVPVSAFGDGRRDAAPRRYRALPGAGEGALRNRFVGHHLLYGSGSGWGRPRTTPDAAVHAVRWARMRSPVRRLALPHVVDRIEAMGNNAVVVGADSADLHFSSVRLAARPELGARYTRRGASQGETRSHGFFYRADGAGSGVLGLPVRGPGRPGHEQLEEGSASIVFLANRGTVLRELGDLAARPERDVDDGCVASCVDWYGNARPLFLRGRIFALMGYELVEGALERGRIREVRRSDFTPRPDAEAPR